MKRLLLKYIFFLSFSFPPQHGSVLPSFLHVLRPEIQDQQYVYLCPCFPVLRAPVQRPKQPRIMFGHGHRRGGTKERVASIIIQRIVRGFIGRRCVVVLAVVALLLACRTSKHVRSPCVRYLPLSRFAPTGRVVSMRCTLHASTLPREKHQLSRKTNYCCCSLACT